MQTLGVIVYGRAMAEAITIPLPNGETVSGLWQAPSAATACLVLAHGAGAGMRHPFLAAVATALAAQDIATLRYQFPYMERRSRRPDSPDTCHATVRAAVIEASALAPAMPLFAGGKSFGGRMTSQAQSVDPLPGVHGLRGFPGFRDLGVGADCENAVARRGDGLTRDQARMFDVDDRGVTNQQVRRTLRVGGYANQRCGDNDERQQGLSEHGRSRCFTAA